MNFTRLDFYKPSSLLTPMASDLGGCLPYLFNQPHVNKSPPHVNKMFMSLRIVVIECMQQNILHCYT